MDKGFEATIQREKHQTHQKMLNFTNKKFNKH